MSSNAGLGAGDNEGDSWPCSENDEESPYESEEDDGSGRTLLFLCEEGQLDTALQRVREWDERCPIERIAANATVEESCSMKNGSQTDSSAKYCVRSKMSVRTDMSTSGGRNLRKMVTKSITVGGCTSHSNDFKISNSISSM